MGEGVVGRSEGLERGEGAGHSRRWGVHLREVSFTTPVGGEEGQSRCLGNEHSGRGIARVQRGGDHSRARVIEGEPGALMGAGFEGYDHTSRIMSSQGPL